MFKRLALAALLGGLSLTFVGSDNAKAGPICLLGSDSGVANCSYNSYRQCEISKRGAATTGLCIRRRQ